MGNLCIIPARGGSKRIPRKNIKDFLGKPIIGYSIEASIESNLFDEIMVSTDDREIALVAKNFGAIVPFYRSEENANDYAVLADVIYEVLAEYSKIGKYFEYICCVLPTAPFLRGKLIKEAFNKLIENDFESVFTIMKYAFPIQRSFKIEGNKVLLNFEEYLNSRSQDLTPSFHDSGQIYWLNTASFLNSKKLFTTNSGAIEISELHGQDIDTELDWKLAELKYKMMLDEEKDII